MPASHPRRLYYRNAQSFYSLTGQTSGLPTFSSYSQTAEGATAIITLKGDYLTEIQAQFTQFLELYRPLQNTSEKDLPASVNDIAEQLEKYHDQFYGFALDVGAESADFVTDIREEFKTYQTLIDRWISYLQSDAGKQAIQDKIDEETRKLEQPSDNDSDNWGFGDLLSSLMPTMVNLLKELLPSALNLASQVAEQLPQVEEYITSEERSPSELYQIHQNLKKETFKLQNQIAEFGLSSAVQEI